MKAREILMVLIGFVAGVVAGFIIYRRRKQILQRLELLSETIQETQLYEKAKYYIEDIKHSLVNLLENSRGMPRDKEDEILSIVEEKIKRLEDIISSER